MRRTATASLMVNYRGSTGYGQKFADAIFNDQDGGEAKDVLAGVDAALAKYPWLDAKRLGIEGGSYGGQLTDWLITQTDALQGGGAGGRHRESRQLQLHVVLPRLSRRGVRRASARAVEDERQGGAAAPADFLWERSALRYVANVKTPVMFVHGENDNDVPIAEAEQYYIALKDVGVETIMVRYPREGHGVRETKHQIDVIDRSIAWYEKHFQPAGAPTTGGAMNGSHEGSGTRNHDLTSREVHDRVVRWRSRAERRCTRKAARDRFPA